MDREHAERMAEAHECAADRAKGSLKVAQHMLAATLLRKQFGIPAPTYDPSAANREWQRAENDRITTWKQR